MKKILFIIMFKLLTNNILDNYNINEGKFKLKSEDGTIYTIYINKYTDKCTNMNFVLYKNDSKKCIENIKYNNSNLENIPLKNNSIIKKKLWYENFVIYLTKNKNYFYKIFIKKNFYEIYLPYKPKISGFVYYLLICIKIIIGFYLCFFGIKNLKITILLISFLLNLELFRVCVIFFKNENYFYDNAIIITIIPIVLIFSLLISYCCFKFKKFKIFVNSLYFSYILNKIFMMFFLLNFIDYVVNCYLYIIFATFIAGIIFCYFLVKKNIIQSIIIYTSFMGSYFFIYFAQKLIMNDSSIFEIFKDLENNQYAPNLIKKILITNVFIFTMFIMGYFVQIQFRNKIYQNSDNVNVTELIKS